MKNIDINEHNRQVMLGVITGAVIGLATASLVYRKSVQEQKENNVKTNRLKELFGMINHDSDEMEECFIDDTHCDCTHEDADICNCGGTCLCHSEEE